MEEVHIQDDDVVAVAAGAVVHLEREEDGEEVPHALQDVAETVDSCLLSQVVVALEALEVDVQEAEA